MWVTLATFLFFTIAIAAISYYQTRQENLQSVAGYFLAGRGLSGTAIAGSMLLTNLSAEHAIGLNGSAFAHNLSAMAWEVTAAFATTIVALFFLPKYLRGAFTTLPEFLEERYDAGTRRLVSALFLVAYGLVLIPGALYAGAIAFDRIFHVAEMLKISSETSIWLLVWAVGTVGSIYAIFGGLKAVAVSDTLNGIGLLVGGSLVPIFGTIALGHGDFWDGLHQFLYDRPDKLNAIGSASDPVPFGTIFTGMIFANLFYWGTNQAVIQRALAAKNLAEGQKGILFSGILKILVPVIMLFPGVIAFHLFGDLPDPDLAYPKLVDAVLPKPLLGFFTAVLFGSILSTYNSILNSASTLFCLDIYKPLFAPDIGDRKLVRVGKRFGIFLALFSMALAPFFGNASEGLFQLMRRATGFFNIPVIAIVLLGLFSTRASGTAARISILAYLPIYGAIVTSDKNELHFIHVMGLLFLGTIASVSAISLFEPRRVPYVPKTSTEAVDLTPWKYSKWVSAIAIALLVLIYFLFSPLGLAKITTGGLP